MTARLSRQEFTVPSDAGIELFVREVRGAAEPGRAALPVLLLHGARVPGVPSFDLAVPGGSLAADLAEAGHAVYVMDARGYGGSTRPPAMEEPPAAHPPLVRSPDVVRDSAAVVEWVCQWAGAARLALLGWATGGHWAGYYATLYPERVGGLILHNTLYGGTPHHPSLGRGSDLEDPRPPGRFNRARQRPDQLDQDAAELPRAARRPGGQLLPGQRAPALGRLADPGADADPAVRARLLVPPRRPRAARRAPHPRPRRARGGAPGGHALRPPGPPGTRPRALPGRGARIPGRRRGGRGLRDEDRGLSLFLLVLYSALSPEASGARGAQAGAYREQRRHPR